MRRIAAHYIWYQRVYRMHYIEVDDKGLFRGVYPLDEEIAGTAFYDGVLIPVQPDTMPDFRLLADTWISLTGMVAVGSPVRIFRLGGIPLASAKLGTDHGSSDGYVERL